MVNKIHARRNEHLFEKCYNCPRSPLQTMCPQQQRRMLNSLLLTSLRVNSYNMVIDQFFMPLAHRPYIYAYDEMRSKFFFLANVTFLIR